MQMQQAQQAGSALCNGDTSLYLIQAACRKMQQLQQACNAAIMLLSL
jgi:hypothetical protein